MTAVLQMKKKLKTTTNCIRLHNCCYQRKDLNCVFCICTRGHLMVTFQMTNLTTQELEFPTPTNINILN